MKIISNLGLFLLFCAIFSGCVTTREQMNEEQGVGVEAGATSGGEVKSEDITAKPAEAPKMAEPEVVKKPDNAPAPASAAPETPAPVTAVQKPATAPQELNATPNAASTQAPPATAPAVAPVVMSVPKDVSTFGVDELRAEVARLNGRVEELEHDKQINDQARAEEHTKSAARIAELEKQLKTLQPDVQALPEGKSPFEAGKESFASDKFDEAIVFFTQALEKSDSGKEAEEATYLRGESYFKKQQYNKAIVDYSHFPEKFQKSSYHPKALLRIAEAFEATGRKDDSRAFYSDLAEKFPKTAEGKLAKKRLKLKK